MDNLPHVGPDSLLHSIHSPLPLVCVQVTIVTSRIAITYDIIFFQLHI